jgi:hypothetical protein
LKWAAAALGRVSASVAAVAKDQSFGDIAPLLPRAIPTAGSDWFRRRQLPFWSLTGATPIILRCLTLVNLYGERGRNIIALT